MHVAGPRRDASAGSAVDKSVYIYVCRTSNMPGIVVTFHLKGLTRCMFHALAGVRAGGGGDAVR
jgi:hypothetical protein